VFLFTVYSSAFLLVLGLLSTGSVPYCFLWFSRGCGVVPQSGGGSGWAPVTFAVYPPSCRGGWFHTDILFTLFPISCRQNKLLFMDVLYNPHPIFVR